MPVFTMCYVHTYPVLILKHIQPSSFSIHWRQVYGLAYLAFPNHRLSSCLLDLLADPPYKIQVALYTRVSTTSMDGLYVGGFLLFYGRGTHWFRPYFFRANHSFCTPGIYVLAFPHEVSQLLFCVYIYIYIYIQYFYDIIL